LRVVLDGLCLVEVEKIWSKAQAVRVISGLIGWSSTRLSGGRQDWLVIGVDEDEDEDE